MAAADFCCCCCAPRPHPAPFCWGREVPKKRKSPVASGMAFGHFGVGVGVVKVAVWCKHYMSEILVERKPYFMAVRPRSAYFQASTFGALLATLHFDWLRAQEHHLSWSFLMSLKVFFSLGVWSKVLCCACLCGCVVGRILCQQVLRWCRRGLGHRHTEGGVIGVAWSGFGILVSWFLRLCHRCVMSFKW